MAALWSQDPLTVRAVGAGDLGAARALVFEYLAATQAEAGRAVPASVDELPGVLRDECVDPAAAFAAPGALLLALSGDAAVGCVGLRPDAAPDAVTVTRLYVRPAYRSRGAARLLMAHAHRHAARAGFGRLVLDVMTSRTHVIDFYRRLGYLDTMPSPDAVRYSMVSLARRCSPRLDSYG